jgi:hypothetical protein
MLRVIMLNVTYKPFVLIVFRLNVVMLSVVAPFKVINFCFSRSWLPTASNQNGSTSLCRKAFDRPTHDRTGETLQQRSIVATVSVK